MSITLYSNNCPRCKVLETKLAQKNIQYNKVNDIQKMLDQGLNEVPILEVDGIRMNFSSALTLINTWEA